MSASWDKHSCFSDSILDIVTTLQPRIWSANFVLLKRNAQAYLNIYLSRRGSPVDRRPSTAEPPEMGEIRPFSKMAVAFELPMQF